MEPIPDMACVAKNQRQDGPGTKGKTNITVLLKEHNLY